MFFHLYSFGVLKQSRKGIFCQIPLPDHFLNTLNHVHDIKKRQIIPKRKISLCERAFEGASLKFGQ